MVTTQGTTDCESLTEELSGRAGRPLDEADHGPTTDIISRKPRLVAAFVPQARAIML